MTTLSHSTHRSDLTTPPAPAPDGASPAFSNGSLVDGKYLVEETVAEGGIGVVVVAKHLALDQRVAIKYLKPKARGNPSILERFVREGKLAAQIASDHVVRVLDVGSVPEGGPYIVMEYLAGEDLAHVVRRGPVPIARAVDYILQACDALAAAHALRIIHRDIKPENLFLAERPANTAIIKLVDFGISKVAPTTDEPGSWGRETADGERFGTPLYMSPEQLRASSSVDTRTDVWSLGVTLHELLTGSLPFEGDDLPQLCASILTSHPMGLTSALPDAPPILEAAILRCLEKDPDARFQNLAELAQELAPFGSADAAAHLKRIREVIAHAGERIRPPTPFPGTVEIRPSVIAESLARARALTTGGRAATMVTARTETRRQSRRRSVLAWSLGVACAAALAFVSLERMPTGSFTPGARGASAAVLPGAPGGPPAVTAVPAAIARPAATIAPPPAAAPPVASAPVPSAAPVASTARARPRPPPVAPSDRRVLFGDRK
ncbi:MAG TPA: serine/threonine-protein kinase [Polyangiaceae bacterium]|jgi:serine/threonine-protein kinase|nr:serine/threonine-protein kinase [Polyangiaceae bacterium]